ncbi:MAG TPA: hypothetical protein VNS58_14395 [Puia sp.]|nr:hypothetical protein [Puia sp.]
MKSRIRKMLMGDTVFSEYSKITVSDDIREEVYLVIGGTRIEVSRDHWILCIEPIVFGVWIEKGRLPHQGGMECHLYFGGEADLTLEVVDRIEEEEGALLLMKLQKSRIYTFPFIKTWLLYYRYYRRGGLSFERFKSFVAAYCYPRRIRLISFRQNDYFNMFPMDLLGDIAGPRRYVFGLRHSNTALPRILETRKLVVSEVSHVHKDIIYQLGKHHSGSPPSLDNLPFGVRLSKDFAFYIPDLVESYKEIRILRTMNLGSHMLLWGEASEEQRLTGPADHLFLVHFLHYLYQKDRAPYTGLT